jgi:uncharacterized protein (DUF2384 family)
MTKDKRPYFSAGDSAELVEGELRDIRSEAERVCGADWLITPNVRFGGQSPIEVISAGKEYWVRDVLRSIKHGDFS